MLSDYQRNLGQLVLSAVISGSVVAAIVGGFLKFHLDGQFEEFRAQRGHDLSALTELVGPTVMQLARSGAVAQRYSAAHEQLFGDALILSDANRRMRELLLTKAHLMPAKLIAPSQCLVEHYDIWLQRFERTLADFEKGHEGRQPRPDDPFDVGYAELTTGARECGDFPEALPRLYNEEMARLQGRLFRQSDQ